MGAYMYAIEIKREPQKVRYQRKVELDGPVLTLSMLRELVTEDEIFSVEETEGGIYSTIYLSIDGYRMETPEETAKRVASEEAYMIEYNKRKSKF